MNFFRLRIVNTLLFFAIGILIGFILKERFYGAPKPQYPQRYQSLYSGQAETGSLPAPEIETAVEQEETEIAEPPAEPAPAKARKTAARSEEDYSSPLVIEASETEAEAEPGKRDALLRGSQEQFFRRPGDYAGRELEMELQMITAKRSARGWRLNFVYSRPDKSVDYLYVDDDEIVGDKPDLRIGYVYKVRFRCTKGDASSGNVLLLLAPTGDKASWATGLSAVE